MRLLKLEAQVLCDNPGTEVVDEARKDHSLWLLLEGIQDDVKHPGGIQVKKSNQGFHLARLQRMQM